MTTPRPASSDRDPRTGLLSQSLAITRRNLIHIKRMPEMLMDVTIQPVMFVVLFAFVFGGSIAVAGRDAGYNEWLMAGIMGQTIAFASFIVAIGLTADIDKGIVDRMRSLPIHIGAVLVGRSLSSLIHSSIGILVMSLTGLVIGWRIRAASSTPCSPTPAAAVGLRDDLGRHPGRLGVAVGRGGQGGDVHRDLPAHLPGQHLRAHRAHAGRAARDRRVEPDLGARPSRPRAVGQRRPAPADAALAAAAPGARDVGLDDRHHGRDGAPVVAGVQTPHGRVSRRRAEGRPDGRLRAPDAG